MREIKLMYNVKRFSLKNRYAVDVVAILKKKEAREFLETCWAVCAMLFFVGFMVVVIAYSGGYQG